MSKLPHINIIEAFFKQNGYPNEDIEFQKGCTVKAENAKFFVESTIGLLRAHPFPDGQGYLPYYRHLYKYYLIIKNR